MTEQVYAQPPRGARWRVGELYGYAAMRNGPDVDWIARNTGIDVNNVERVAYNEAIDAWVIHLKRGTVT